MTLGPFLLGAPLALIALAALPVIWWLLRATPPAPKEADLPSLRLLEQDEPREETPVRTPWWIILMRTAAAALAIVGLSQPIYAPGAGTNTEAEGPLLIVIDDGWASAPRWSELIGAADAAIDGAARDTPVHLLLTAPRERPLDPADRLGRQDAARQIASLTPQPWAVDRNDALARLDASGLQPGRILWATHGLTDGTDAGFADALAGRAPLTVFAAPPKGAIALTGLGADGDGVSLRLRRTSASGETGAFVTALTLDGTALATQPASFEQAALEAEALFTLPAAALNRVSRFVITGTQGAGAVWLWDSTERRRSVGLVATGASAQPLLSDLHYVRRALEPFASLSEGDLTSLITARPDAIVLTDVGSIPPSQREALSDWIEGGGALIRFAGPRLAAQGDALVPTPLRRASRALGGALAWDQPQALASFSEASPFAGLSPPSDALVRQQVLAQPVPDLQARTWARLEDGSPIVTAERRGAGAIILFHVTAGPDWSDLPYTGTFAQMLRRAIAYGRGEARDAGEGAYIPQRVLDGYGQLTAPGANATPLQAAEFDTVVASETHPPGLYQGPAGIRSVNAAAGARPAEITNWPLSARLLGEAEARSLRLAGPLLSAALVLLAVDLILALALAGRLPRVRRQTAALLLALVTGLGLAVPPPAHAQRWEDPELAGLSKAERAAVEMRFGYILTGDRELDERTRAGLEGLSRMLFRRTSVEPATPDGLSLETDALELYPLIYFSVPASGEALNEAGIARLNTYLRTGGALVIDTRGGADVSASGDFGRLETLLGGLDAPPLMPVPEDHVLTKSFYLINEFPGRYGGTRLWVEAADPDGRVLGDGVSRLFVGEADWIGAWAIDDVGNPLYAVDGGNRQREMAYRFGINLAMYVLTGNYKADQVHIPALLERLNPDGTRDPLGGMLGGEDE